MLALLRTPTAWDVDGCSPTARVVNKLHQPASAPAPSPQPPSPSPRQIKSIKLNQLIN